MIIEPFYISHSYKNKFGARILIEYTKDRKNLPRFMHKDRDTTLDEPLRGLAFYLKYTDWTRENLTISLPFWVWEKYGGLACA